MTEAISTEELHILRHSLGLDDKGKGRAYRNHYACDPEPALIRLCELGLMVDRGEVKMWGGMHYYAVTDAGRKAATP